ncbi:argininosuccinate lyase [Serendipita sp. 400]|nr:argininosuccinate lyase [Serendipita sp. 400]
MIDGLQRVGKEWKDGVFEVKEDDEDIHTANERRLSELIGPLGGKLHTGRSRNDQVATDMRLWLLDQVGEIEHALKSVIGVIAARADQEKHILMPGYTHLQVRPPSTPLTTTTSTTTSSNVTSLLLIYCTDIEGTTDSLVSPDPLPRFLPPFRPPTPPTTRPSNLCSTTRIRSTRWKPIPRRSRLPR